MINLSVNEQVIIDEFCKPIFLNKFYISLDGLIENSKALTFDLKWESNPQQFCLDYYKHHLYYPVVLLVNNINSMFEFKKENLNDRILAPNDRFILSLV